MSSNKCYFEDECRQCGRRIEQRITAKHVGTAAFARIRCAECDTTNAIHK